MIDARIRNKKTGRIAVIVEEDKKYKTAIVQYEDDGKEQNIASSTLKRWWEPVDDDDEDVIDDEDAIDDVDDDDDDYEYEDDEDEEDDEEDDVEEDPEEVEDEDLAGDGTPLKEVGKEIAAQAKKKVQAAKKESTPRKKSGESDEVKELVKYAESYVKKQKGEIFQPESQPRNRAFKVGGHMYARLLYSKSSVTVACRKDAVAKTRLNPTKSINHMFSELYTFTKLDKKAQDNIVKLLDASLAFQKAKNENAGSKKKPAKVSKKEEK